jgi:hypothetical protein
MGVVNYATSEINKVMKMGKEPNFFSLKATSGNPMLQEIAVVDTYQDVVFTDVVSEIGGDLTYDNDKIVNNGTETVEMAMNLACTLETATLNNVVIHIGQAQNGVIDEGAVSSSECSTAAELQSLNIATKFTLESGNELNLKIMANKLADINIYHFQVVLKQIKTGV